MSDAPFVPEEELTTAPPDEIEARYRARVIERYNRLSLTGLPERDPGLHDVSLEQVFVKLNTEIVQSGLLDGLQRAERQRLERELAAAENSGQPLDRQQQAELRARLGRLEAEARKPQTVNLSVADALQQHRHLVVVGGPGSGKTTLTRWLALRFAQGSQAVNDALGPQFAAPRLPILLELRRFAERFVELSRKPGTTDLSEEIVAFISTHAYFPDTPADFVRAALADGRCLLLIDGLDEIADLKARQAVIESITAFVRRPDRGYRENLCIVTSRPHGFNDVTLPGFQTSQVQPFAPEDVDRFIHHWYATAYGPDAEGEAQELIAAIHVNERVLDLAANPLLCTIIAIVYRNNRVLPNRRVALYLKCCEALLDTWERNKAIRESGLLGGYDWQTKLELLAPLAWWLHQETERLAAPEEQLAAQLATVLQEKGLVTGETKALNEARIFLTIVRDRSGLLQGRGDGTLEFAHRTFQEYLAARYIAAQPDPDYIDLVMEHLHEAWWREVHLLVIGHLGSGSEGAVKASKLLLRILHLYRPPWRLLRPVRFNLWVPKWLKNLVNQYGDHRILKWPVNVIALVIVVPPALPAFTHNFLVARLNRQLERRLAWVLAREFLLAATGFDDCAPLGTNACLRFSLAKAADDLVMQMVRDPGLIEVSGGMQLPVATRIIAKTDQMSSHVVSALLAALVDSDESMRLAAAHSLGHLRQASQQVGSALLAALVNFSMIGLLVTMRSLTQLGRTSPQVVSALLAALKDSEWRVRQVASHILGKVGQASSQVVSALMAALADSEWRVQEAAAQSLGQLGKTSLQVESSLLAVLVDPDQRVRQAAALGLVQLGKTSPQVVSALLAAFKDPERQVRQSAAQSLGGLGQVSSQMVSALVAALADSDSDVRQAAAKSLGQLGRASPQVVSALMAALADSNSYMRDAAAQSLGGIGQVSPQVVSALVAALADSDSNVQQAAAQSLVQLDQVSPQVVSVLIAALADSKRQVRQSAAQSLGGLGQVSPQVVSALIAALADSESWVRETAAQSLGRLGQVSPQVVSALLAALSDTASDWFVRLAAAERLIQLGQASPEVISALLAALAHSEWQVRRTAAANLGQLGQASPQVVSALMAVLADSEWLVREAAAQSLGQLKIADETQLRKVLIALNRRLHDRDDDVRRAALTAIRQLLDGRPIPGYRWVPIRERRERFRRRQIVGYWVIGITVVLLLAWVAAGVATYLRVDPFIERFVAFALALAALTAGGVQILSYFRRPPWDR